MPEGELTRRQKVTIRMLQEAYVDLLEQHKAEEISIVMLCQEADVNRTTFYRYFLDLEDFRTKTVESLFSEIFAILGKAEEKQTSSRKKILYALNVTMKNKRLLRHLLSDSRSNLAERLLEEKMTLSFMEMLKKQGVKLNEFSEKELHLLTTTNVNAIFQTVEHDLTREEAMHYADTLDRFFAKAWKEFFGY